MTASTGFSTKPEVIRLQSITKRFGNFAANSDITLGFRSGEIHAIVGENGAGKTTLMRILFGMYNPDAGEILWHGTPARLKSPADALKLGIGMVHQHFMLVPSFTVAENVTLGDAPGRRGLYDRPVAEMRTAALAKLLHLTLAPGTTTGSLSVGLQQKVEILKLLYRGASVLIFDEPTAVLAPQEAQELFVVLRELAGQGHTVVFISHKLPEVLAIADRISVIRRGRLIATLETPEADGPRLAALMTDRDDVSLGRVQRAHPVAERTVLSLRSVTSEPRPGDHDLVSVSLSVHEGEIVGVAGVEGNGQISLAEAIVGLRRVIEGEVVLAGDRVNDLSVGARRDLGLSFVPEDRQAQGLSLGATIQEAIIPAQVRKGRPQDLVAKALTRRRRDWAQEMARSYAVRTPSVDAKCSSLSGGNQQKVVLARELSSSPECVVLAQPTRGVDIGAIEFVYSRIASEAARGCGVLLISADLDEIFRLSDRVIVLYGGQVVFEASIERTTPEEVGRHMTGLAA